MARLLVQGQRNAEIAAALSISVKAVEGHVSNVLAKLGLVSRGQLIYLLQRQNPLLLDLGSDTAGSA